MSFKKKVSFPLFYERPADNFSFLPTMSLYFFFVFLVIGVLLFIREKLCGEPFGVYIFIVLMVCAFLALSSLVFNSLSFFKAVKSYGRDVIGGFSYGNTFRRIDAGDKISSLRFGDLRFKKYYAFPKSHFFEDIVVHATIDGDSRCIKATLKDVEISILLAAFQIVTFSGGYQALLKEIENNIAEMFLSLVKTHGQELVSGAIDNEDCRKLVKTAFVKRSSPVPWTFSIISFEDIELSVVAP